MNLRGDRHLFRKNLSLQRKLTPRGYRLEVAKLIRRAPCFAEIIARWGIPPFWTYPPGFPGIVLTILGQQVSIESARATFRKLEFATPVVSPDSFLALTPDTLKTIGFSHQKTAYARKIAEDIVAGVFDLEALESLSDMEAKTRLMQMRGIGGWTADTYLLFASRRPDIWPTGDLALEIAVTELRGLSEKLKTEQVDKIAEAWKPQRAVAARILWHQYLNQRKRFQNMEHARHGRHPHR